MSTKSVNREIPFDGLHWMFDHCETISDRNIERVKALGGVSLCRTAWLFKARFRRALRFTASQAHSADPTHAGDGVPVGAGTDATRVSSYNPYLSLYWLITGKTVGGLSLYPQENRLNS